jgi:hypothetical protein
MNILITLPTHLLILTLDVMISRTGMLALQLHISHIKMVKDLRLQIFSLHDELITFYLEQSAHMIDKEKTSTCP